MNHTDFTIEWYLAWARLALTPSITNRGDGSRPRKRWKTVGEYAEKRKSLAAARMIVEERASAPRLPVILRPSPPANVGLIQRGTPDAPMRHGQP